VKLRTEKVERIANEIPPIGVDGEKDGELVVIGWGSTYGAIRSAVTKTRERGKKVSQIHLRYLNPMPKNLGDVLSKFKNVLVPEMNLGQLSGVLRMRYLIPTIPLDKIQGLPFKSVEIEKKIEETLKG
jgi:2-oxoglutarate ferredoxin oxidoreductase subunit alpha